MKTPVIVVVDRNPIHRNLINYNLVINRFLDVHTFLSGEECLYRLKRNLVPDFIITDLNPGDNNGFDFLEQVKALSPGAKIIFFAAFADPETAVRLHEAGATDYIPKTNKPDIGISVLIKNIRYLVREKALS